MTAVGVGAGTLTVTVSEQAQLHGAAQVLAAAALMAPQGWRPPLDGRRQAALT